MRSARLRLYVSTSLRPFTIIATETRAMLKKSLVSLSVSIALAGVGLPAHAAEPTGSIDEVRNTVVNLLEALVRRGVMTSEQATAMVTQAQEKAEADAKARAAQDDAEGAVRVTYVPEIVQQQISDRVRQDIRPAVVADVVEQARVEGWGIPGALPEWLTGVKLYGDVRARAEGALYAEDNAENAYLDFNAVNDAGGIGLAGVDALLNTSEERVRAVGRARFGLNARVGDWASMDFRIATGNDRTPNSTNQTMGTYGSRWTVNVDRAAILFNPVNGMRDREFDLRFGRFANPFVTSSELIWDNDLSFEGFSATYAMDVFGRDQAQMERGLFLTIGGFPLQEAELTLDDKWLLGAQLGFEFALGRESSLRFAVAYHTYLNMIGARNTFDSELLDFTAPSYLEKGNTLFDIRNDSDPATNLFALAGEYELASASMLLDIAAWGGTHVMIGGEYVTNIGWDEEEVFALTGRLVEPKVDGYDASLIVGWPVLSALGHWRAFMSYRYLERDAVLDAFTDSDFRLGGTDTKGYQVGFDLGLTRGTWMRLRYLSANEIDGPPLGIDVFQLDVNAQF